MALTIKYVLGIVIIIIILHGYVPTVNVVHFFIIYFRISCIIIDKFMYSES